MQVNPVFPLSLSISIQFTYTTASLKNKDHMNKPHISLMSNANALVTPSSFLLWTNVMQHAVS